MTKCLFETKTNIFFTQKIIIFMTKRMNRNQNYNKCKNRGVKNFDFKKCFIKYKFTILTLNLSYNYFYMLCFLNSSFSLINYAFKLGSPKFNVYLCPYSRHSIY
jgi:hypothetical protein